MFNIPLKHVQFFYNMFNIWNSKCWNYKDKMLKPFLRATAAAQVSWGAPTVARRQGVLWRRPAWAAWWYQQPATQERERVGFGVCGPWFVCKNLKYYKVRKVRFTRRCIENPIRTIYYKVHKEIINVSSTLSRVDKWPLAQQRSICSSCPTCMQLDIVLDLSFASPFGHHTW